MQEYQLVSLLRGYKVIGDTEVPYVFSHLRYPSVRIEIYAKTSDFSTLRLLFFFERANIRLSCELDSKLRESEVKKKVRQLIQLVDSEAFASIR